MRKPIRDWAALVEEFKASRSSQQAFCDRHGIRVASLRYWLKKDRATQQTTNSSASQAKFVQLDVIANVARRVSEGHEGDLVVELPLGVILRFRGVHK